MISVASVPKISPCCRFKFTKKYGCYGQKSRSAQGVAYWSDELCGKYIRDADIIVTEGFKRNGHPKIEVFRSTLKNDLISRSDANLLAVAGDKPPQVPVPYFDSSDVNGIVNLIEARFLC